MTMTDTQLGALAKADDREHIGLFIAGWLAGTAAEHLPLTPPFEVDHVTDSHSMFQPHFTVRTAAGFNYDVRVMPAPSAADLVETWRDGLHSPARSVCPTCGSELMTVGLPHIAYTFEVCTCGNPRFDHLVEQLWHRTCLARSTDV